MSLSVKENGAEYPIFLESYNQITKEFVLKDDNRKIEVRIPYVLKLKDDVNPNEFSLYLLFNNESIENHIFQLNEGNYKKRLGWLFPLQALVSSNHDYSENTHFLRIAAVAFKKLVKCDYNQLDTQFDPKNIPDLQEQNGLNEFYQAGTIILILHKPAIQTISDFEITDYLPFLYRFGYSSMYNPSKKIHPNVKLEFIMDSQEPCIKKSITARPISKLLREEFFIKKLFSQSLNFEEHPIVRFYLLYQVIELLIDKIFHHRFKKIFAQLNLENENLWELQSKIQEALKELPRLNHLFNKYTKTRSEELRELCLKFLNMDPTSNQGLPKLIYSVRSELVHNYRQLNSKQFSLMNDINYYFELVIINVLISYTEESL